MKAQKDLGIEKKSIDRSEEVKGLGFRLDKGTRKLPNTMLSPTRRICRAISSPHAHKGMTSRDLTENVSS